MWMFCCIVPTFSASPDKSATSFGRAISSTLDDPNPQIRGYGWQAIGQLGRISGANQLHTLKFEQFLSQDRALIIEYIEELVARAADTSDKQKSDSGATVPTRNDEELSQLKQLALSVPEFASLAIAHPNLNKVFDAETMKQFQEAALRQRPQLALAPADNATIGGALAALESPSSAGSDGRRDASAILARTKLDNPALDRVEGLLSRNTYDPEVRRNIALALIRNGRPGKSLIIADDLLAAGVNSTEQSSFALDILTSLLLASPSLGRQSTIERAGQIIPLLSNTELFIKVSAVLSQVPRDDLANAISTELMKRIEVGDGLSGSVCISSWTGIGPNGCSRCRRAPSGMTIDTEHRAASGRVPYQPCIWQRVGGFHSHA
jgi:hypothetical protein